MLLQTIDGIPTHSLQVREVQQRVLHASPAHPVRLVLLPSAARDAQCVNVSSGPRRASGRLDEMAATGADAIRTKQQGNTERDDGRSHKEQRRRRRG